MFVGSVSTHSLLIRNCLSILSVIHLQVSILSMLLHTLPKYHNLRPVAEGSKFTCFWSHPCLTFSDVADRSHKRAPVASGHSVLGPSVSHSRGWWRKGFRVRGQWNATCSVVCHMAWPSWMTVVCFESRAQSPAWPTAYLRPWIIQAISSPWWGWYVT